LSLTPSFVKILKIPDERTKTSTPTLPHPNVPRHCWIFLCVHEPDHTVRARLRFRRPHVNFDHTQVDNYAQWKSREANAAARENPKVVALIGE